jgi:chromosome segregation ATPase
MPLGGTARKLQTLADTAETLYEQLKELQQRMVNLEESVDESTDRLDRLETESEKQRLILEAIAAEHDVDVDQLLAESAIAEAEPVDDEAADDSPADPTADDGAGTGSDDAGTDDADPEPTVVDEQGNTVE